MTKKATAWVIDFVSIVTTLPRQFGHKVDGCEKKYLNVLNSVNDVDDIVTASNYQDFYKALVSSLTHRWA